MTPLRKRYAVVIGLLLAAAVYVESAPFGEATPLRGDLLQLPARFGAWTQISEGGTEEFDAPPTDGRLSRVYRDDREEVSLFIDYQGKFRQGINLFEGRNLSPGKRWNARKHSELTVEIQGKSLKVHEITFKNGGDYSRVTYWYFMGHSGLMEKGEGRIRQALDAMLSRRTDAALIRVSSSYDSEIEIENYQARHARFIQALIPVLMEFLPYEL